MKKHHNLSGEVFDFFALLILFLAVCISISFFKHLLFRDNQNPSELTLITEAVPVAFEKRIDVGDTLYDTLTKRELGKIKSIERIYSENRVKFIIKTNAEFTPRSDALRTRSLWFRIKTEEASNIE